MINQELIEEIGKYINMYYTPKDKEVKSYKSKEFVLNGSLDFGENIRKES